MVTLEITIECAPEDVMPTLLELVGAATIALRPALPAAAPARAETAPDEPEPTRPADRGNVTIVDEPQTPRQRAWHGLY